MKNGVVGIDQVENDAAGKVVSCSAYCLVSIPTSGASCALFLRQAVVGDDDSVSFLDILGNGCNLRQSVFMDVWPGAAYD